MNIRTAHRSDSLALATAHIQAWREAYSHILPSEFLAALSIPDRATRWDKIIEAAESFTAVAEIEGQVSAFVSYGRCRDADAPPNRAEIWALYAAPAVWGSGAGRGLLDHALNELTSLGVAETSLWVLSDNQRGRRFYKFNGFAPVAGTEKWFELGGAQVQELRYMRRNAA
jgi:ribosomal protein S18 acetylase RimI-like enzyme